MTKKFSKLFLCAASEILCFQINNQVVRVACKEIRSNSADLSIIGHKEDELDIVLLRGGKKFTLSLQGDIKVLFMLKAEGEAVQLHLQSPEKFANTLYVME